MAQELSSLRTPPSILPVTPCSVVLLRCVVTKNLKRVINCQHAPWIYLPSSTREDSFSSPRIKKKETDVSSCDVWFYSATWPFSQICSVRVQHFICLFVFGKMDGGFQCWCSREQSHLNRWKLDFLRRFKLRCVNPRKISSANDLLIGVVNRGL